MNKKPLLLSILALLALVWFSACSKDDDEPQPSPEPVPEFKGAPMNVMYGTTTVNINGGTVVRNVYGAGAMGSVGKTVTTTANNVTTTTISADSSSSQSRLC